MRNMIEYANQSQNEVIYLVDELSKFVLRVLLIVRKKFVPSKSVNSFLLHSVLFLIKSQINQITFLSFSLSSKKAEIEIETKTLQQKSGKKRMGE